MPRYAKTPAIVNHEFMVMVPNADTFERLQNDETITDSDFVKEKRPPIPADGLLNTKESAGFLGLSPHTLAKWRITGYGPPYYRLGRRILYSPTILRLWSAATIRVSTSDSGAEVKL